MDFPRISIITVNYNEPEVTYELLNSIRRSNYPNIETWVVDNASREDITPYINVHYPEVKTIRSETNLGFAGGNNLAVKKCTGDYIFFINNDAELTEGALETLVAAFEKVPRLGMVSPKICFFRAVSSHQNEDAQNVADRMKEEAQAPDIIQYAGTTRVHPLTARNSTFGTLDADIGQFNKLQPTAYAHGAAMMVSREALEKVGTLWEHFFLYYEELDWCARIRKAGFEIYVEPNAKIYHKESLATGKISALKTYYITRNRILFMRRNHNFWQLAAFTLFLTFVTIPKNVIKYLLQGDTKELRAFGKAVWWNVLDVFSLENGALDPIPSPFKDNLQTAALI